MNDSSQINFWAHMLDESSHMSYYDVFMQEHPEDKMPQILDDLLRQFSEDLKKDHIDLRDCVVNGVADEDIIEDMQKSLKHKYIWDKIKAQTYAAIISRMVAIMKKSKNQKMNEMFDFKASDVAHNVSRRTIESCLDIICHNTNVLDANNKLMLSRGQHPNEFASLFSKHNIPLIPCKNLYHGTTYDNYIPAISLYKAWAAYSKGSAGEKYVCDSDNGPEALKKILDNVEYSADDIDLIVAVNKSLDVVHLRSDLAAAFIEGGKQTCAIVSNLPDEFVV